MPMIAAEREPGSVAREAEGATPRRKPMVTMAAARRVRAVGRVWVWYEETAMVSGRTMPRAICWTH